MSNQISVVHFVCDRIPDQNGCIFIECEDENGNSINAGEWRLRGDGLVELVVSLAATPGYTAGDMSSAETASYRGLAEHLIERLATAYPDSETTMTVECFADWLNKEVKR